ncbi:MAG: hypothetical protein Q27BB25_06030 [Blastomonas sp. CACIA14H2]|nr:MAG: hypothetical protein Q27BB25_06030 [Blastomonas sp. CACIA14H2]
MMQDLFLAIAIVGNVITIAALVRGYYWQRQSQR